MPPRSLALTVLALAARVRAHGFMSKPLPRQYRDVKPISWSNWMGIAGTNWAPGYGNVQNLNAAIGGGTNGGAAPDSRGLCGASLDIAPGFDSGEFGQGPVRATAVAGGALDVEITITAYHKGWHEFRLAVPSCKTCSFEAGADGGLSQDKFNTHVLQIAAGSDG